MVEAALVFGVIIFLGIGFIFYKLPWVTKLKLLNHDILLDIVVSVTVLIIHFGTMTGLMAATVAGLICAAVTGSMKKTYGYIKRGRYYPGVKDIRTKIAAEIQTRQAMKRA